MLQAPGHRTTRINPALFSKGNSNANPSSQLLIFLICNILPELNVSLYICFPLSHLSTQLLANSNLAFSHTSLLKLLLTRLSEASKSLNSMEFSHASFSLTVATLQSVCNKEFGQSFPTPGPLRPCLIIYANEVTHDGTLFSLW